MKRSELFDFLQQIGAKPKKGLSQNFLIDSNILHKIVALADVGPGDYILEIGPGPGALTTELLQRGAHVLAVEMDQTFAKHLHRLQTSDNRLTVICDDFLRYPLTSLPSHHWKVVANLPYKITTPILEKLCQKAHRFTSFTIMVQKEVADRIRAHPKTKTIGSLTLFLQFYTTVHGAFLVSPHCFYPEPSVSSTVVRLDTHEPPPVEPDLFFMLVRRAYQHRRKMIATSLKSITPNIGDALERAKISAKARPEDLSLQQWLHLFEQLTPFFSQHK